MRLKRSRLQQFWHRRRKTEKDKEGGTYETYGPAFSFTAELWPAGGKIQAQMYGERLPYIQNLRISGKYRAVSDENGCVSYVLEDGSDIMEGDGICLYVSGESQPDYRILSIRPYRFLRLEVEKRG